MRDAATATAAASVAVVVVVENDDAELHTAFILHKSKLARASERRLFLVDGILRTSLCLGNIYEKRIEIINHFATI